MYMFETDMSADLYGYSLQDIFTLGDKSEIRNILPSRLWTT